MFTGAPTVYVANDNEEQERTVFVSYAHEDQGWIQALELEAVRVGTQQARFWVDRSGIHTGDDWTQRVSHALSEASAAVLLISENFLKSRAIMERELPAILERYRAGELAVVFVPIGDLNIEEVSQALQLKQVHNIVSVPSWENPLPVVPQRRPDIREQIVSAVSETPEVQNLRRNLASKYRLERKLPEGALGQLFIASDTQLQRKVCVKLLTRQELQGDFEAALRKIANATLHTHVLTLYGAYLDRSPPHFIRQCVAGESLRSFLDERKKPAAPALVQVFLTEVGDAVVNAHKMGVAGLSIKPTSIMLTEPGSDGQQSFLISLSLYPEETFLDQDSWRLDPKNKAPFYLPPEHRSGSRADSNLKRSDQYRLGVVAYEMLVGATRFEQLAMPLRERELDPNWHWPSLSDERVDCPEELCAAIDRMVSTDPERRYDSLCDALRDIARDLHVQIARESYRRVMSDPQSQEAFFRTFYVRFLKEYPRVQKELFARLPVLEDDKPIPELWRQQFQKLKEAVLLLLVFSALGEEQHEPNILTRVVESHVDRKIPAGMYEKFAGFMIDCLVDIDHQPDSPPRSELRRSWERVVRPGVDYMRRRTEELNDLHWRS